MGTSRLRHTPRGRGSDARDACHDNYHVPGCLHGVPAAMGDTEPITHRNEYLGISREVDPLNSPLPDAAEAAAADRVWADWRERLERLLHDPNVSERTQTFLESLDEQLADRGYLTPAQTAAIESIEERRDGGRARY